MTETVVWNYIYNAVCILCAVYAAIPSTAIQVIPAKYQPYVVGFFGVMLWLKSHWNLFTNPQGVQTQKMSLTGK